jgi:hypothetical protein
VTTSVLLCTGTAAAVILVMVQIRTALAPKSRMSALFKVLQFMHFLVFSGAIVLIIVSFIFVVAIKFLITNYYRS